MYTKTMNETSQRRMQTIISHLRTGEPESSQYELQKQNASAVGSPSGKAIRVCLTGAAGQIGYALLPMIASGQMFGPDRRIVLNLLEIPIAEKALKGVVMELEDGAFDLLEAVNATLDPKEAFKDVDVAILVGSFPRKPGMERKDLLSQNGQIFKIQGQAINQYASRHVKVLVVGNPANTNCLICQHYCPDIPPQNFSALTRLDHNRAIATLAKELRVKPHMVKNVIIWGNHSTTQYPDVNHAVLSKDQSTQVSIRKVINNDQYLNNEFISKIQKRGAAVLEMRGQSSAFSAARAIVDHMRDWIFGTPVGEWVSMAVVSDGSYGIPKGLVFSFPVTCQNGSYKIVQGLKIDEFSRQKLETTTRELIEERNIAFEELGIK